MNSEQKSGPLRDPLNMVIREHERLGGWGSTTYCKFMEEVFGHPLDEDFKPVRDPVIPDSHREYPHRLVHGLTRQGLLLVLRSREKQPDQSAQCVAFTGDIRAGEIRAWPVTEIRSPAYYNRFTAYVLSRTASVVLCKQPQGLESEQRPIIGTEIGYSSDVSEDAIVCAGLSGGRSLRIADGPTQTLENIGDLHLLLEQYKAEESAKATAAQHMIDEQGRTLQESAIIVAA